MSTQSRDAEEVETCRLHDVHRAVSRLLLAHPALLNDAEGKALHAAWVEAGYAMQAVEATTK